MAATGTPAVPTAAGAASQDIHIVHRELNWPLLTALQIRMFRALCPEVRSGHTLFGELEGKPEDQFTNLEAVIHAWILSKRYTTSHQMVKGRKTRVVFNEHRLGLLPLVAQTLNNYVCASREYGAFKHPDGIQRESMSGLVYAHREWDDKDKTQYSSYAPREKLSLDSVTSLWHWKSPYTNTLSIHMAVPDIEDLENPKDVLCMKIVLPEQSFNDCVAASQGSVALIWTGSQLLLVRIGSLLSQCSRNKQVFKPTSKDQRTAAPHFFWRGYKEHKNAVLTIYFFPKSPACQRWATAYQLDTDCPWEEALMRKLSGLHERLLTNDLLPKEQGIAYVQWGSLYDRMMRPT